MNDRNHKPLFTPHPIWDREWPPLTEAEAMALVNERGADELTAYVAGHERRLKLAEEDPLRYGFDLPHWEVVNHWLEQKSELYLLGGNGSAKTEFGAKHVARLMASSEMRKVLCVARSEDESIQYQQSAVYKYLPRAARAWNTQAKKRRNTVTKINWSQAGGFTEGTFVLPNRCQCFFKTVAQYERDPLSFEGPEYDFIWIDEGCPLGLLDTLRVRASKRAGKLLFTFTAVHGMDAACNQALEGATLVKSLPMQWDWCYGKEGGVNPDLIFPELKPDEVHVKGCPPGHMPFIMQPMDFAKGVVFMWTHWNPFLPRGTWNKKLPAVFDKVVGRAKWQVRVRLFGIVQRLSGALISNFNPKVHVIPHAKIEALLKSGKLTTYMAADPAGARSYYLQWMGVDEQGRNYIFDECPRYEEGEWVGGDGEPADGQKVYAGIGINELKRIIREREREHGKQAERRIGDPRAFATKAASEEGGVTLFELFGRDGEEEHKDADLAPMEFTPARIRQTQLLDVELIVDKLAYNSDEPISIVNEPKLYISDRCQNTIKCWLNYDGRTKLANGRDNPYKDGVDCTRYLLCEQLPFVDENIPAVVSGGGWG